MAEVDEGAPLEAFGCAALGEVTAGEREVGLARRAEVAGAVAEDDDDVAGTAQGAEHRSLA